MAAFKALHRSTRPESWRGQQQTQSQMSMSLTNKGLLNPTGHNNCFLNSCVQVLWHVDVFRRSFREFKGHTCVGKSCIFCALQELFQQFQHSRQSALPPDDLRKALASCYQEQHRFQLGIMDDAAECFEKILEQIHYHLTGSDDLDSCSSSHCLSHQTCSLSVLEMTECQCGETSEPLAFVQFVHYISAPSLGIAAKKMKKTLSNYTMGDGALFGNLVRGVSGEGEERECVTCNRVSTIKKMLLNSPDLVCIGMIWDSDQPNIDDIMSVVETVGTFIRVSDMFHRVMSDASSKEYCLSGMVAYYGHHYCTFCYHTVLREWGFFDDANFRSIGSNWSDVVNLCRKAHYQPLLLVYANPFADKITMVTAPREVTKVVVNDNKTNTLSPVTEETKESEADEEILSDVGKKEEGENTTSTNSSYAISSTPPVDQTHPGTKLTQESNSKPSHSSGSPSTTKPTGPTPSSKSREDSGYTIDPNTLSIRRKPVPSLYPQLSLPGSEGRGEVEKGTGGSPVPSAPPLSANSPSSHPKTTSNFPVIFQTTPPTTKRNVTSQSSSVFPVFFQPTPSAPLATSISQTFPSPFTSTSYPASSSSFSQTYTQPSVQRGGGYNYSQTVSQSNRGYPPPTYSYGNTPYPSSSVSQDSPWGGAAAVGRGGGGRGGGAAVGGGAGGKGGRGGMNVGFSSFLQPQITQQQQPQPHSSFLLQSSPNTSPSLFQRKQFSDSDKMAAGPYSVPGSPAKHASHNQRASSMQPSPTTSSARPRPSPPHSVPPPDLAEKTNSTRSTSHSSQPSSTNRDLIELSLSPAHFHSTNKPLATQGHPSQPPSLTKLNTKTTSPTGTISGGEGEVNQLSSLEEDLIQWSLSPNVIQSIQRYRGRLRQSSSDNLGVGTLPSRKGNSSSMVTGGVEKTETHRGQGSSLKEEMDNTTAGLHTLQVNQPRPATVTLLDDIGNNKDLSKQENTSLELIAGEKTKTNGTTSKGVREAVIARKSIPDPLYADPDDILTTTTTAPQQHTPATTTTTTEQSVQGQGAGEEAGERKERPGLGEDPLYAVPEQVAAKMRAKKALLTPSVQSPTTSGGIPESVEPVLREALEMWRKAESKKDTDIAIARISYSRAATLLMKVLVDPSVDQTLKQNISNKRQEALSKCSEMESLLNHKQRETVYGGDGKCKQCGQSRQLNSNHICGPCHLKNKISQT